MEVKLLHAFVELAETGHYGRAAEKLHVTQSTLSKQIKALEDSVGGAVFERGRHGACLTSLGELLLKEARPFLRHGDELGAKMRAAMAGRTGHLTIAFGISTLATAPRLITRFRQAVPDCQITLNDMSSTTQHQRILAGRLDLGFCRAPENTDDLSFVPVLTEHLALVVPPGTTIPPQDRLFELNDLGFVKLSSPRGPGLDAQIGLWCGHNGFKPRIIQQADDILTVHSVVAAGLGAAMLPWHGAAALGAGRIERSWMAPRRIGRWACAGGQGTAIRCCSTLSTMSRRQQTRHASLRHE